MKFTIDASIFTKFPNLKVGYLFLSGLNQDVDTQKIQQLMDEAVKKSAGIAETDERIVKWRDAFASVGLHPSEIKPAHIALLERAKKDKKLPDVMPLVNLTNSFSLKYLTPIGTHSLDHLTDDVVIRLTRKGDVFKPMNQAPPKADQSLTETKQDELAYTSGHQVLTRHMVYRQGDTSKMTLESHSVLIPIDTFEHVPETALLAIIKELKTSITELFGAKVETGILSQSSPSAPLTQPKAKPNTQDSKLLEVLSRGVAEVLPSVQTLAALMQKKKIKVYLGIDPTGSLLTLGHSVVLRKLQQFAELGHDVILLIGNGTVRIGDPTGRDSTRPVLTDEQIEAHFKDWKAQASRILDFDKITIVHNGDWLDKLSYADVIKLMAQTTVQQLIERDMFQERLKKNLPIFGHEIMYPLMQGYDSVAMNVDLEIGGTDQTFNMMMGRHLQRVYNNHEKWVLTTPIINGTDGRKMSKSYGNFVALTENPNDMYGKLMSIDDNMIVEYFTLLTDEPMHSVEKIKLALESGQHPLPFKKRLAFTITQMYHTKADAIAAEKHFESTVQRKQLPDEIPVVKFKDQSLPIIDILAKCEKALSKSQLRRLIEQGGIEIIMKNHDKVKPESAQQPFATLNIDVIRIGKRKFVKVKV